MNTEQSLKERAEARLTEMFSGNHETYIRKAVIMAMIDFLKQELQRIGEVGYVPVSVEEKPEQAGWYLIEAPNNIPKEVGRVYFNGTIFLWNDNAGRYFKDGCKLNWLKKLSLLEVKDLEADKIS